jgi:hypothetical protein
MFKVASQHFENNFAKRKKIFVRFKAFVPSLKPFCWKDFGVNSPNYVIKDA